MKQTMVALALATTAMSGCVVTSGSDLYEVCADSLDCNDAGAFCASITADWGDRITTDNICTWGCIDSSDCPISNNGNLGLCVDFSGTGFRCYETCQFDVDCDPGFRCGDFGFAESLCFPY